MLQRIRQRLQDMRTLRQLFTRAEHHARAQGQSRPGAEHFLLAAIELPDGTARRAFERIGANPDAIPAAIEQQYRDALAQAGIQADMPPASPLTAPQPRAFHAQPSGQSLVQALAHARKGQPGPLLGAHVVALVAAAPQGVATRTLKALRLDPAALVQAAQRESAYPPA